ncbi:MAG: riboflavin synthase [Thermacetogeniaceae bacterium]
MFTGIVEEIGVVRSLVGGQSSGALTVDAVVVLEQVRLGDSIAINGACLTVTGFSARSFTADVMPETLRKTNLGSLQTGDRVNLERALTLGGRLGGHLVTGHVDGTGAITGLQSRGIATEIRVLLSPELQQFVIPQGSVALDGVSLTIAAIETGTLMVGLIPHTRETTTLGDKRVGDLLNIETDLLGKYVNRLLRQSAIQAKQGVTADLLIENGFI